MIPSVRGLPKQPLSSLASIDGIYRNRLSAPMHLAVNQGVKPRRLCHTWPARVRSVVAWIGAEMEFALSQAVASGDAFEHRPSEGGHCVRRPAPGIYRSQGRRRGRSHADPRSHNRGHRPHRRAGRCGSGFRCAESLRGGAHRGRCPRITRANPNPDRNWTKPGPRRNRKRGGSFRQEELRREIEARRLADRAALEAQWALERVDVAARESVPILVGN